MVRSSSSTLDDLESRLDLPSARSIVIDILAPLTSFPADRILPTTLLRDELGLGSLELLELVIELEQQFSVALQESSIDDMRTVADVLQRIEAGSKEMQR